jgi:signal transduction histidine kinase
MSRSMTTMRVAVPQNYLLEQLDTRTRDALRLAPVDLQARQVLHEPGMPLLHAYFPVSGVISLVSTMQSGSAAEVALVGREGMVGLSGVYGTLHNPTTAIVQISGQAFRVATAVLKTARLQHPAVQIVIDRYTQAHLIQVAQTSACNALHSIDARLARWLLTVDDRINGEPFTLSQELMAQMLGAQRPTVSTTMQRLLASKAIARRGRATVIADRPRLERAACECYGVLRREFERLRAPLVDGLELSSVAATASEMGARGSPPALEALRQIAGRLLLANIREQEAREEAEVANRAKDQFLAVVSHELRNPLNAILGWCAVLNGPNHGSVERGLHVIQRNATAQLKLIEDLLDTVRLASSTLALQPRSMNLADVVQDAVDAAQPMADEKHVTLRLAIVDELSPMLADAGRLRQVFLNVLTNAVKFTDGGGSVEVDVTAADRAAHVTIRDTGRGIARVMLPHVFERFQQGGPSGGDSHGCGLGLTIALALVELHGGRIQMASPGEGLGTTCTIDLPLMPA